MTHRAVPGELDTQSAVPGELDHVPTGFKLRSKESLQPARRCVVLLSSVTFSRLGEHQIVLNYQLFSQAQCTCSRQEPVRTCSFETATYRGSCGAAEGVLFG